jgi:hypothetical protein
MLQKALVRKDMQKCKEGIKRTSGTEINYDV